MSRRRGGLPRDTMWLEGASLNNRTYRYYYRRIQDLAISQFEWIGLPEEVDQRYLELVLFQNGVATLFRDEDVGRVIGLECLLKEGLDIYRNPVSWQAHAVNGYHRELNSENAVLVWNNYVKESMVDFADMFARRLYNLDRIVDVNCNAQKTPVLIKASQEQRMTMKNLYEQYDGNAPFIFGCKDLNTDNLSVLKTDAPYVADAIYSMKVQIWNEMLGWLGIQSVNYLKKERMITDEVTVNNDNVICSRYSRLQMRKNALPAIKRVLGLDVDVVFRSDDSDNSFVDLGIEREEKGGEDSE